MLPLKPLGDLVFVVAMMPKGFIAVLAGQHARVGRS